MNYFKTRIKILKTNIYTIVGQSIEGIPPHGGWGQAGARDVAFNTFGDHEEIGTGSCHLNNRY